MREEPRSLVLSALPPLKREKGGEQREEKELKRQEMRESTLGYFLCGVKEVST